MSNCKNNQIEAYQPHLSEIEDLVQKTKTTGNKLAILGPWLVNADKKTLKNIKANFNFKEIVDLSIVEVNQKTPTNDWYAELTYSLRVRKRSAINALTRILNISLTTAPPENIVIHGNDPELQEICKQHSVHFNKVNVNHKSTISDLLEKTIYHLTRAIVGLNRITKHKTTHKTTNKRNNILVGSSDIYRLVNNKYENPVTGEPRRELNALGYNVIYMSSPHDSGEPLKKLKAFMYDKGAISPEAITFYYILKNPISFACSLFSALGPLRDRPRGIYLFMAKAFDYFLTRHSIHALIISGEYSRIPKTALTAANKLSIPTSGMQHGVIHPRHPGYTLGSYNTRETTPKSLFVHGKAYCNVINNLQKNNAPKLFLSGNPSSPHSSQSLSKKPKTTQSTTINILFASQPQLRPLILEAIESKESEWVKKNVEAIIKLHPAYEKDSSFFNALSFSKLFKKTNVESTQSDLYGLLRNSDILVSRNSTVLQEALFLGVPVIEVLDEGSDYSFVETFKDYLSNNSALTTKPENMLNAIEKLGRTLKKQSDKALKPNETINAPYQSIHSWLASIQEK